MSDTEVMKTLPNAGFKADDEHLTESQVIAFSDVPKSVQKSESQGKCCLTVKPKGVLIANVNATKIFIEGKVEGDLSATVSVTIRDSGDVAGNIVAPKVAINEGATFNGSIEMRAPKSGGKK